uniref:TOG domain-containing protein n=1 Tax=Musa acuminata subsp. malaccensis TaxID=214687 RepID=A0A804JD68_MUSAM
MDPQQQQQQQVAAILGPDAAPFESLVSQLMSSSNEQRSHAESLFNLCRDLHPDALAHKLASLLHSSPAFDLRAMSALLLRKLLTYRVGSFASDADLSYLWPRLSPSSQASLKSLLLSALHLETDRSVSRKLSDAISVLASSLLPDSAWPELLPFLFHAVSAPDSPRFHDDVRIAALSTSVNLIMALESASDRDRLADLLSAMMRTLTESLNSSQEATAQEALELLIELAGVEPRFIRHQLADVVGAMLQIAEADGLEEGTRHLAIEFLVTLAEARERAPGMMRKLPQFVGRLFAVLMRMLLDIEDDPAWHTAEIIDENAGETSNYGMAQECLDRISVAMGGNTTVPIASELLPAYLAAPEWQRHHAALITLAQIAEGCSKVMTKNLEQVVNMALNSFQHPHARVRWAAINAVGQLSTDLGPDLQVQYHQRVLPALASAMDDFQNPRAKFSILVQAHAGSAVLNFCENCTPDILPPYLDGIVGKLLVLLQNGKQMVQEGALTALASVADLSQENFQKYYDAVMTYLKVILVNATDKSNRMLRAKSMECISLVGMAVGKENFLHLLWEVMEVLMTLQGSQMETDDPTTIYMLQAWARFCKCLGQDFLPYMSVVMPPLLQSAQLKPDVTITSVDSDDDIEDSDDESIETITIGDKRIGIRTSVLEEKATACNMLCCYADELKEGFYPWIDQVAPILVPLLKFYFHEEVRRAAVSAMPDLLHYIIPALLEALQKEPETEICASMLDSLNECMQLAGAHLIEGHVKMMVDQIKHVMTASVARKKEMAERAKEEDFDDEDGEMLKEDTEEEEEVFDRVGDCLSTLIKYYKASFLPFFDELSIYITPMLGKDKTAGERRIAICVFDDVAEHCQGTALKYYETYLPFLLEACNDEDADVRQAAVYGVGVCSEFGGSVFGPLVGEALSKLNNVVRHPDALQSDNIMAYDNAVSALGKICQFHRDSIDAAQVLPAWLSCLPVRGDLIEAKIVHDQLCSMLEKSDRELLGPNNQHLPKIITVLAEVLCAGNDLATEHTVIRMINLLRQLQQTIPPSVLASTWSTLQPQQQLALQSMLSS